MSNPLLHSLHLPPPRRVLFRLARQILLEGRPAQPPQANDHTEAILHPAQARDDAWVLVDGDRTYPLRAGVNLVGRFEDNHVVVGSPLASRRHCALVVHPGQGCEVHDTASKNGTYVNGQRVTAPKTLAPGDAIELGGRRLVLVRAEGPDDPVTLCGAA